MPRHQKFANHELFPCGTTVGVFGSKALEKGILKMRIVKFHFYVTGKGDKGFISPLIGEIGWIANKKDILEYLGKKVLISHEEVEFTERFYCEKGAINTLCFSSATRGGKTGVRFAPSSEILSHAERWITIEVMLPDAVEQAMFDAAKSIEGAGYDYMGIIGKTTWFTDWFQSYDRWYCSEACNWVACEGSKKWENIELNNPQDLDKWSIFDYCYDKHRRWSPVANLVLMLKAGYQIEVKK
jgi:hypothetical protein